LGASAESNWGKKKEKKKEKKKKEKHIQNT